MVVKDAEAPYLNSVFDGEPTTEHQSIWTRVYNKYIFGLVLASKIGHVFEETANIRKELNISSANDVFTSKLSESVKLVNSFFGLEASRAVGPMVNLIGPIMPSKYPKMDPVTLQFMSTHDKVAYIAFGHYATPSAAEFEKVLVALIDSVEADTIDGFIWATVRVSDFPEIVTTSRGINMNVTDILHNSEKYPHYKFAKWAPQFSILAHPSTAFFMTHGGANSIFESLYNGKKMLVHPYFADQPYNSKMMRSAGVALVSDRHKLNSADIAENIRTLVDDKDGYFEDHLTRMSALVQLKARDSVPRSVAVIEEVLFTSRMDDVPHLYPASRNMTYMKANNIDIQMMLAASVISLVAIFFGVLYVVVRIAITALLSQKKMKKE